MPYLDLSCGTLATVLWFALPQVGAWPLVLALLPWILRFIRTGRLTRRTPFDLPLILFVLTATLSLWAAYDRQTAWSKLWLIVGAVLLFYAFATAHSTPATVRVGVLTALAGGLSLYYLATNDWTLLQSVSRLGQGLQRYLPRVPGPRVNPNEVGGLLAMLMPFVTWGAGRAWQRAKDSSVSRKRTRWLSILLAWAALAAAIFGLIMTASRGAWLACGVTGLIAALWWTIRGLKQNGLGRQRWARLGLLVAGLIAVSGLGFLLIGLEPEHTLLTRLLDPRTWLNRLEFQRNSLILAKDYPMIGAGLDGFEMLYSTYAVLLHVGYISQSHNLYMAVAIDQGLPGLLALTWIWVLFAAMVWHSLRQRRPNSMPSTTPPSLVGVAVLSLIITLLHGTVETALYGRGVLFLFVPIAFAVRTTRKQEQLVKVRRTLGLMVLGLPLGLALLWPKMSLSVLLSNLGAVHQSQEELSRYSWPEWSIQDAVRRKVDLSKPVSDFEGALALNPDNATANRRLGMIELSLGQYEDALAHLEAAYRAEPNVLTTRQLLGEALIVNGRLEEGQALWSGVSNEQRQLELRVDWYRQVGDAQRAAWINQAASSQ